MMTPTTVGTRGTSRNWALVRWAQHAPAYLVLVVAGAIVLWPFVWTLYASFVASDLDLARSVVSLDAMSFGHYRDIVATLQIGRWFGNSVIVTVAIVGANLALNTMAGYALARLRFPGRGLVMGIVVGTMMMPPQILFVPLYTMIVSWGWLNTYWALIIPFIVNPFGAFLMRQFFVELPQELDDAGRVDGLGRIGFFFRIALPVSAPAIATQAILLFVWNWNSFVFPSVLVTKPEMFTLPVGIYQITHTAFTNHVAQSMAGVILTMVPTLIVFVLFQRRFVGAFTGVAKG